MSVGAVSEGMNFTCRIDYLCRNIYNVSGELFSSFNRIKLNLQAFGPGGPWANPAAQRQTQPWFFDKKMFSMDMVQSEGTASPQRVANREENNNFFLNNFEVNLNHSKTQKKIHFGGKMYLFVKLEWTSYMMPFKLHVLSV